jgi:hypothetical protein
MSTRAPDAHKESSKRAPESRETEPEASPLGQSPDHPIEFEASNEVARGNAERANAEPEPAALHNAEVPGKPDVAKRRREIEKHERED